MQTHKAWLALRTPVTMVVLLLFVVLVGTWGYRVVMTPIPKRPPDPCVMTKVGPQFTATEAWIRIYNGTSQSGLAKNVVKLVFGNAGFHVFQVGNAEAPVEKTYVMGVSKDSPEVVLVMSYLPEGTPFIADTAAFADHMVNIYLGADFKASEIGKKPVTSIPLPDEMACLPAVKPVSGS